MSKSTPPPAAAAAERSPDQWADVLFPRSEKGNRPFDFWKHEVAEQLHGWSLHAHHEGAPMLLSRATYEAALEAAGGDAVPHAPALSKHRNYVAPKPKAEPKKENG